VCLEQAFEHRIVGLVVSAVLEGSAQVPDEWQQRMQLADAAHQLWHRKQLATMQFVSGQLDAQGLPHLFMKGAVNAERWYDRPGERQSIDVDVVLSPLHADRWLDAIGVLSPAVGRILHGATAAQLRDDLAIKLQLPGGTDLDVHFDVLQCGVPSLRPGDLWQRRQSFALSNGLEVSVLDPETALIQQLIELNRDRFSYLQNFADISRILASTDIDWERVDRLTSVEGAREIAFLALETVVETLGLPHPHPVQLTGWRVAAWRALWPKGHVLRGDVGMLRWRQRERLLPFLVPGRRRAAFQAARRYYFPDERHLAVLYPDARGPYLFRNWGLRYRHWQERRGLSESRGADLAGPES